MSVWCLFLTFIPFQQLIYSGYLGAELITPVQDIQIRYYGVYTVYCIRDDCLFS